MTRARATPTIAEIMDWLTGQGLRGTHFETLIEQLCEQLLASGLSICRANFSMRAHHPEIGAFAYRWKRRDGIVHEQYERSSVPGTGWEQSPLKHLLESNSNELRHALSDDQRPFAFPVFEELVEQGATDYFATQTAFTDEHAQGGSSAPSEPTGLMVSWCSDAPGGFSENDLDNIRRLTPVLGLALKSNSNYMMAKNLLGAYLGADASGRVMSGAITRGSVDGIQAVILYCDLQGFTRLSESLGPEIIEMLNEYFGAAVPLIEARGGNVLKFMGDGLLAIFDKNSVTNAELAAVQAICDLRKAVAEINTRRAHDGLQQTGFTMAAHAGEVFYGNIGASNRLDFTVIGPAVNTTARILSMCSNVDQTIVIGSNVAQPLMQMRDDLVSLGQYRLRGVADRQELFTLD